jgi:peptidoglycan/LPS O-acetylase OafA/YrhL
MFRATATDKSDRLIGELSYPLYIFHMFALTIAGEMEKHLWGRFEPAWTGLILALVLSVIALALEARYVEPWRSRFSENRVPIRGASAVTSTQTAQEEIA